MGLFSFVLSQRQNPADLPHHALSLDLIFLVSEVHSGLHIFLFKPQKFLHALGSNLIALTQFPLADSNASVIP
jgi:hypothetical protein